MDKLSKNARFLRLLNGYCQQEVADILHVSRTSYLNLESGKTQFDLESVFSLSSFYGISPDRFISIDIAQHFLATIDFSNDKGNPAPLAIISKNIKLLRTVNGLSQEYVASMVNLSRSTYSAYEAGNKYPSIHTLLLLASLFKIDINMLINYDLCDKPYLIKAYIST